jgi:hypothetical protein
MRIGFEYNPYYANCVGMHSHRECTP